MVLLDDNKFSFFKSKYQARTEAAIQKRDSSRFRTYKIKKAKSMGCILKETDTNDELAISNSYKISPNETTLDSFSPLSSISSISSIYNKKNISDANSYSKNENKKVLVKEIDEKILRHPSLITHQMRSKSYDLISETKTGLLAQQFNFKIENQSPSIYQKNNAYMQRKELPTINDSKRALSYSSLVKKVENHTSSEVFNLKCRMDYKNTNFKKIWAIKSTSAHGKCNSRKFTKVKGKFFLFFFDHLE